MTTPSPFTPFPTDAGGACEPAEAATVEALRRELAERDDVMALVAHELRNPLHVLALQLSVARLTAQAPNQPPAEVVSRIEKAQSTLQRYTDRVTVLLDLVSSSQGGASPFRPREVDLTLVLRGLVEQLTPEARYRGVDVELAVPASCPARLDPLLIEQVVDNLMLNAFKHAACSRVVVRLQIDGDALRLEVADNGRGVSPEDRERIFGKFCVGASPERRGNGSGLGLWIVRRLSAVLGGAITLSCPPGGGCVFVLTCPLATPESGDAAD